MALTTTAAVKQYMGITGSTMDAQIESLIPRAQAGILNYLQRNIERGSITETRDGNGGIALMLRHTPVVSVESVSVNGVTIPAAASRTATGWWLADRVLVLNGYRFSVGIGNVVISYTAGYDPVPGDIAQCCIEIVALLMKRPDHVDVSSKTLAGETIAYLTADMTPSARAALGNYRRVAPLL